MLVMEELACVGMCIDGHVIMIADGVAIGRGCCYRLIIQSTGIVMFHGTLVELSTGSSLSLHVYAYEDDLW